MECRVLPRLNETCYARARIVILNNQEQELNSPLAFSLSYLSPRANPRIHRASPLSSHGMLGPVWRAG